MKKVVKFGGSSLADAGQFKKVKDIVMADPGRRYPCGPGLHDPHPGQEDRS